MWDLLEQSPLFLHFCIRELFDFSSAVDIHGHCATRRPGQMDCAMCCCFWDPECTAAANAHLDHDELLCRWLKKGRGSTFLYWTFKHKQYSADYKKYDKRKLPFFFPKFKIWQKWPASLWRSSWQIYLKFQLLHKKDARTTQINYIKDGAHISRLVKLTVVILQR